MVCTSSTASHTVSFYRKATTYISDGARRISLRSRRSCLGRQAVGFGEPAPAPMENREPYAGIGRTSLPPASFHRDCSGGSERREVRRGGRTSPPPRAKYAAFGKGQRRATGPRQFDSAEPHQRSLQICMVSISCYGRCRENAGIMTQIRRFAPCPPSDDFPRWNETSASGSGVVGLIQPIPRMSSSGM